jgi:hypothetical protein
MEKSGALFDPKFTYGSPIVLAIAFIFVFLLGVFFIWAVNNATEQIGPNMAAFKDKDTQAANAVYTQGTWAAAHGCLIAFVQADNASIISDTKKLATVKVTEIVNKYDANKLQDLNTKVATCTTNSIPASWGGASIVSVTKSGTDEFSVQTVAEMLTQ